jgi:heme o synthase
MMNTEPEALTTASARSDLMELARPRLAVLGLLMVVLAYVIARPSPFEPLEFGLLLLGSGLALAGASILNQVLEHRPDALMKRTAGRPLPAGRMPVHRATAYGLATSVTGFVILAAGVNVLTAACAVAGWGIYLFAYTPLKPRTSLNTVVGAIPGAVPVLMGWAAARGTLDPEAWLLFGILFLWQLPHFLAIAWMYQVDYARAGFRMLPAEAPDGSATARQVVGACLALVPVSLLPTLVYLAGPAYFFGALALGLAYLAYGFRMGRERTGGAARRLLRMSVLYLPALFVLLALDRGLARP